MPTTPPQFLGFDIYGTLVNPYAMNVHLHPFVGDKADRFAELWREKQVEYSFRRGLMGLYADFSVCTAQALAYTSETLRLPLSTDDREQLMAKYLHLPAFPDAHPGLASLHEAGHHLVAFSNGAEKHTRPLLRTAGLYDILRDVVSVDDCQTFKPAAVVYHHLLRKLGADATADKTWVISSNPFDVIGAKAAGLRAVWVKRGPEKIYDPWGIEPDLTVASLEELAGRLEG